MIETEQVTFFGCGDHVDSFGSEDEERGRKLVTEKPELRFSPVSNRDRPHSDIDVTQTCEADNIHA